MADDLSFPVSSQIRCVGRVDEDAPRVPLSREMYDHERFRERAAQSREVLASDTECWQRQDWRHLRHGDRHRSGFEVSVVADLHPLVPNQAVCQLLELRQQEVSTYRL